MREWLRRGLPLGASTIVWTELLCGALTKRQADLAALAASNEADFARFVPHGLRLATA